MNTLTLKNRLEEKASRFFCRHLKGGLLCLLILSPIAVLLAVTIATALLVLPAGVLFGWL